MFDPEDEYGAVSVVFLVFFAVVYSLVMIMLSA